MQDRRSDHVNSFTRGCRKLSWGENFHGWHFSTGVSSSRRSVSRLWDDAVPLSLSLFSPPPLTLFFLFVASSPTPHVSLARDTQMRPSILRSHCYSKCSLPIVTMAGHSWHCCQYCYYYHYCYRLRPTGEWRRGEPAASSSAALEANYTPSGPPSSLFFSFSLCPSKGWWLSHSFSVTFWISPLF